MGKVLKIRLHDAELAALKKRAKREALTVSALIRRFALGLATLLLVACGGPDFQNAPHEAAGSAGLSTGGGDSGGAGMGTAGAPQAGSPAAIGGSPGLGGMPGIVEESAGEGGSESRIARGQPCELNAGLECESGTYCDGYNCIGKKTAGGRCEFDAACNIGPCVEMVCKH